VCFQSSPRHHYNIKGSELKVKIESTKSTLTPLYYNDDEVKIESTKSTLTPFCYNDDEVKIESTLSQL
jgi:hypothetical protein